MTTPTLATSRQGLLASFGIRSYRNQWFADVFSAWGAEMETIILGWYVLVTTESVFTLSILGALGYVGTLFAPAFGVAGGVLVVGEDLLQALAVLPGHGREDAPDDGVGQVIQDVGEVVAGEIDCRGFRRHLQLASIHCPRPRYRLPPLCPCAAAARQDTGACASLSLTSRAFATTSRPGIASTH